ncbi:MAG: hypothetical protein ACNYWU_09990 [Desulfobacterales bacterium]
MIKGLQILIAILFTAVFALSLPCIWLGVWPELDFIAYLSNWQIYGTVLSSIAIYVSVFAYIFGWNPQAKSLAWLRRVVIMQTLTKANSLLFLALSLFLLLGFESRYIYTFDKEYSKEIVSMIWAENYAGADRLIGEINGPPSEIAELFFINDSIRQQFFSTSQNANKELCRIYANYFSSRSLSFDRVWSMYLIKYAHASCMQVLENPKESIALYNDALHIARWISSNEERRTARKIATIYFHDTNGMSGIKGRKERLRTIIQLIGTDSNPTAQRMLGSSYYLLGEYAKASETWNDLVDTMGDGEELEKKKILNNISMAYIAQFQYSLAMKKVNEGISLAFDVNNEKERREQIRLLSTKTLTLVAQGKCEEARSIWDYRNSIRQQQLSKCTSLITTQVLSCNGDIAQKKQLIDSLLIGVGQAPESFIDFTEPALKSLVEQANTTFSNCYIGLKYPKDKVLAAVMKIISSNKANSADAKSRAAD